MTRRGLFGALVAVPAALLGLRVGEAHPLEEEDRGYWYGYTPADTKCSDFLLMLPPGVKVKRAASLQDIFEDIGDHAGVIINIDTPLTDMEFIGRLNVERLARQL